MKTYGELLSALIAHYEKCIKELPPAKSGRYNTYMFAFKNKVDGGICFASANLFGINLVEEKFTADFTNGKDYLCKTINDYYFFHGKTLAKYSLQRRIDRMKKLLPKWENVEIDSKPHIDSM